MVTTKPVKRLSALLVALALILSVLATPAYAVTKTVGVRNLAFSSGPLRVDKYATKVVKNSTVKRLKFAGNSGYLKFTAPATATYTFTFKNLRTPRSYANGYVNFRKVVKSGSTKYLSTVKCYTQSAWSTVMYINSKAHSYSSKTKMVDRFLPMRYGRIKLKKGQTIYLYLSFDKGNTIDLTIK